MNRLFAIHWEAKSYISPPLSDSMLVYPNPFTDVSYITFKRTHNNIRVDLYNESRAYLSSFYFNNTYAATIERRGLPAGVYYAIVYNDFGYAGTVKLIAR